VSEATDSRFWNSLGVFSPSIQLASPAVKREILRRPRRRRQMIEIKRGNANFVPPGHG
jgi:hypothetical protein